MGSCDRKFGYVIFCTCKGKNIAKHFNKGSLLTLVFFQQKISPWTSQSPSVLNSSQGETQLGTGKGKRKGTGISGFGKGVSWQSCFQVTLSQNVSILMLLTVLCGQSFCTHIYHGVISQVILWWKNILFSSVSPFKDRASWCLGLWNSSWL